MTRTLHDHLLKPEYKKKKTYHVIIQFDPSCSGFVSNHTYKNLSAAAQAAKRRQQKYVSKDLYKVSISKSGPKM